MEFNIYFNGVRVDRMEAANQGEAQLKATAAWSRPVVAIPAGASIDERAAAAGASIKLNQAKNYSQPLSKLMPSGAAGRVECAIRCWPSGARFRNHEDPAAAELDLMDVTTVLLQRDLVLAALRTAGEELAAAGSMLGGSMCQSSNDTALMILKRLASSINATLATAVQS